MGAIAFLFYFPVIERYLFTVHAENEWDDCQAWILARAITAQLKEEKIAKNKQLLNRIAELTNHVLQNRNQYATSTDEQDRIIGGWNELRESLGQIRK